MNRYRNLTAEQIRVYGGGTGGNRELLKKRNPIPQIDDRIEFYDYAVLDKDDKLHRNVEFDVYGKFVDKDYKLPSGWRVVSHKYFVDGIMMRESMTTFIKRFHRDFDDQAKALELSLNAKPGSEYYGKTKEEILQMWIDNRVNGTMMHEYLELFYNDMFDENDARVKNRSFEHFMQFHEEFVIKNDLVRFRTELRNFDQSGTATVDELVGTADMIYQRRADVGHPERGNNVIIVDWKFIKKMYKDVFYDDKTREPKMCFAPYDNFPDVNLYHYYIQLMGYCYMLERRTKLRVTDMYVADFGERNAVYQLYEVPRLFEKFECAVSVRNQQILRAYITKTKRTISELCDDCTEFEKEEGNIQEDADLPLQYMERIAKKAKILKQLHASSAPLVETLIREQKVEQRTEFADTSQTRIDEFFSPKTLSN